MKSYLFISAEKEGKVDYFRQCILELVNASTEDVEFLAKNLIAAEHAETKPEYDQIIEEGKQRFSQDREVANKITIVIGNFLRALASDDARDNEADFLLDDAAQLTGLSIEEVRPRVDWILKYLEKQVDELKHSKRREATRRGLFPFLVSVGHTVEIRAVTPESDNPLASPQDYKPELGEFIPIASVVLSTDRDDHHTLQMDLKSLDLLLSSLNILRKNLIAVAEAAERLGEGQK